MAGKNTAVFGIYPNRVSAERAVDTLKAENFRNTDISVLLADNAGSKDFAHEMNTKSPEGATAGATSGAVAGGILGWLAGIGALAIPGKERWPTHRRRPHHGSSRRCWSSGCRGWNCRRSHRNGNSGIRSEAV